MGFLDRIRRSASPPKDLLERFLLVPTPEHGRKPGEVRTTVEDEEFAFVLVDDAEGRTVLPAFTSEEALTRWKPEGSHYVGLQEKVLVELLAGSDWDRIVVNGADADAFAIMRSDALEMGGVARRPVAAGSTALIGNPAQPPPSGLVDALRRACEQEPSVSEAYVYQVAIIEVDEMPHLTVGLKLRAAVADDDTERIAQTIGAKVEPAKWGYEFVDFHFLEGDMLDTVRDGRAPVYKADQL